MEERHLHQEKHPARLFPACIRTPLSSSLALFGDLPAEHGVHLLHQLRAHLFDSSADLCEHQIALQAPSLCKDRHTPYPSLFTHVRCVKCTNSSCRGGGSWGSLNVIKGEDVLPPYLSGGFWRSLSCLVQIHISPRQNNIIRFLHLDESEGWKKRVRLFIYKSV